MSSKILVTEAEYNAKIAWYDSKIDYYEKMQKLNLDEASTQQAIYDEYSSFKAQISAIKNEVLDEENNTKQLVKDLNQYYQGQGNMNTEISILDVQERKTW